MLQALRACRGDAKRSRAILARACAMRARNDPPGITALARAMSKATALFLCFDFRPTRLILTRVLRSGSLARAREA
jgi:hypothetical protein